MARKVSEDFVSRWGDNELDDKQYTRIPGFIMRNYHKFKHVQTGEVVGITAQEFTVMSHIVAFKFDVEEGEARPGLGTIAAYMGVSIDSVRRAKNSLRDKGAMLVEPHDGKPSNYSFPELVRQCRICELETQTPSKNAGGGKTKTPRKSARRTPRKSASPPLADLQGEDSEANSELKELEAAASAAEPERPNIYAVWEQNIGVLTPIIADELKAAEADYPPGWVEYAIKEAALSNGCSWKYVEAILVRWKKDGLPAKYTAAAQASPNGATAAATTDAARLNALIDEELKHITDVPDAGYLPDLPEEKRIFAWKFGGRESLARRRAEQRMEAQTA